MGLYGIWGGEFGQSPTKSRLAVFRRAGEKKPKVRKKQNGVYSGGPRHVKWQVSRHSSRVRDFIPPISRGRFTPDIVWVFFSPPTLGFFRRPRSTESRLGAVLARLRQSSMKSTCSSIAEKSSDLGQTQFGQRRGTSGRSSGYPFSDTGRSPDAGQAQFGQSPARPRPSSD